MPPRRPCAVCVKLVGVPSGPRLDSKSRSASAEKYAFAFSEKSARSIFPFCSPSKTAFARAVASSRPSPADENSTSRTFFAIVAEAPVASRFTRTQTAAASSG